MSFGVALVGLLGEQTGILVAPSKPYSGTRGFARQPISVLKSIATINFCNVKVVNFDLLIPSYWLPRSHRNSAFAVLGMTL